MGVSSLGGRFFEKRYEIASELALSTRIATEKKKHKNKTRSRLNMMNEMTRSSEVSGYCKKNNGSTSFYSFPCDAETALQKGQNAMFVLA